MTTGGFDLLAPLNTLNANLAHQPFNHSAGNINLLEFHPLPGRRMQKMLPKGGVPQFARPEDRPVLLPYGVHLLAQISITLGAIRCSVRIALNRKAFIEGRRGDL